MNQNMFNEKKIILDFNKVLIKFFLIINVLCLIFLFSCKKNIDNNNILYVYNWGIYINETVIEKFEGKYNCKVIYDTFDTNEEMYIVVKEGARVYDVLCPTDYMIQKMINQNLLYNYDISELSNFSNIDKRMLKIMTSFDNNNRYAIPYVHSTLGLVYNKTLLNQKNIPYPTKWSDLWNPIYKNEIILQDAMRDLLMVGLKKNGFSMNSLNQNEINITTNDLIKQKPLINSYLIDQARDKMVAGEASIASMYSGEIEYIKTEGSKYEYEYILPSEGVNFTIDAWVIPQNAQNKELAKKWIDFLLEPDIALLNYDYMHYGISNLKTIDLIAKRDGKQVLDKEYIFPNLDDVDKYEIYNDLGNFEEIYNDAYKKIKSATIK